MAESMHLKHSSDRRRSHIRGRNSAVCIGKFEDFQSK
jgi:hypothetical protein